MSRLEQRAVLDQVHERSTLEWPEPKLVGLSFVGTIRAKMYPLHNVNLTEACIYIKLLLCQAPAVAHPELVSGGGFQKSQM